MRVTKQLMNNALSRPSMPPTGQIFTFPAPTGGWNTRDPLNGMDAKDAVILDNYFPTTADVQLRNGSMPWATGLLAKVETVVESSIGNSDKLWGFAGGKLYDVSAAGAVGGAAISGLVNSRWQFVSFTTSGATRIVGVNGADHMLQYDNAAWASITAVSSPIAITGVDTSTLVNVWAYQKRLFFIQNNSMLAWFLPVDSFGGAAASFDLGGLFKRGGYLMAGGTWTRDGGEGMDDLCVFISTHGEVAVYSGTDPTDPTAWQLIGRYDIAAPIGRRCTAKSGADLALITVQGIIGLSTIISLDPSQTNTVAISSKIRGAYNDAAQMYKGNFGWEAVSYPLAAQVWFNIPVLEGQQQVQFVLNVLTGAWCRFINLNANTFCLHKEQLYFGDNVGSVWLADTQDTDNGQAIPGFVKTAFIYHNGNALKKAYKMIRPTVFSNAGVAFGCDVLTDFNPSDIPPNTVPSGQSGMSFWNTSTWNITPWDSVVPIRPWRKVDALGTAASVLFSTNTKGFGITLNAIDVLFEVGGIL